MMKMKAEMKSKVGVSCGSFSAIFPFEHRKFSRKGHNTRKNKKQSKKSSKGDSKIFPTHTDSENGTPEETKTKIKKRQRTNLDCRNQVGGEDRIPGQRKGITFEDLDFCFPCVVAFP